MSIMAREVASCKKMEVPIVGEWETVLRRKGEMMGRPPPPPHPTAKKNQNKKNTQNPLLLIL